MEVAARRWIGGGGDPAGPRGGTARRGRGGGRRRPHQRGRVRGGRGAGDRPGGGGRPEAGPPVAQAVDQERLADVVEDGHPWIERPEWILEDHLDLRAERTELGARERRQVDDPTVRRPEEDLAARRRDRAEDAARGRRLAAARFADETERLAP